MNGLKYIRIRCNLSLSELAEHLGVSRQIISAWELGKRSISDKNLTKLEIFFGIDRKYFGEISDDEHENILLMPMYMYQDNDMLHYRYISPYEKSPQIFLPEMEGSIDEYYTDTIRHVEDTINRIKACIRGTSQESLYIRACIMKSTSWYFEQMTRLLNNHINQRTRTSLAYNLELHAMMDILLTAFGVEDCLDRISGYHFFDETDVEWGSKICEEIRNHLDLKQQAQLDEGKRPRKPSVNPFPDGKHYCQKGV